MKSPKSVETLEKFGRVRLSSSFFMRDFLYSEIANFYGAQNIPDNPDLAIEVGIRLCEELLEPLNATFGRIAVRSSYRSPSINKLGNDEGHNCASNESNFSGHIWDHVDAQGLKGATACVVVPWFLDRYDNGADWRSLAYWIHDHLPYSELQFFPKLCAFNINWHETPTKTIASFIAPKGKLAIEETSVAERKASYKDFPAFRKSPNEIGKVPR